MSFLHSEWRNRHASYVVVFQSNLIWSIWIFSPGIWCSLVILKKCYYYVIAKYKLIYSAESAQISHIIKIWIPENLNNLTKVCYKKCQKFSQYYLSSWFSDFIFKIISQRTPMNLKFACLTKRKIFKWFENFSDISVTCKCIFWIVRNTQYRKVVW